MNPALVVTGVVDALLVHVGYIDAAVGTDLDIDGTEPWVSGVEGVTDVFGLERRAVGKNIAHHDVAAERMNAEQAAVVLLGQSAAIDV